jgi:hypothetical protein
MASTYSSLKIQLMATGENSGTWGDVTNINLGTALEEAITGSENVSFSSADVTLTLTNTNASQAARNLRLNLTGTSGGARQLIVPAIEKVYIINNGLADTVTVKNSTGTGIAVAAGKTMYVYNDGTNVVDAITHLTSLTLGTPLAATQGGTGANTLTANNVILGNGTSAVQFVAPGTTGNVLTSNGTTWTSGAAAAFDSGTVMLFAQTSAPTGWTKNTSTGNQHALRVVTGTASTGGSVDFTTAFASQTPSGTVSVSGSAGSTTLSTPQIPSHSHPFEVNVISYFSPATVNAGGNSASSFSTISTNNTGGGGSHTHPLSISSATFSGSAINLAVRYIDVIRATKN